MKSFHRKFGSDRRHVVLTRALRAFCAFLLPSASTSSLTFSVTSSPIYLRSTLSMFSSISCFLSNFLQILLLTLLLLFHCCLLLLHPQFLLFSFNFVILSLIPFTSSSISAYKLSIYLLNSRLLHRAFGVLCWEVMTLGQQPYAARTHSQVMRFVRAGGILDRPNVCPEQL